jgi:hypothetical protein
VAELDDTLKNLLTALDHSRAYLAKYDAYLENEQPIKFIAPALQEEFGERITALIINWPRLVTSAFEERLDVEGFRYAGNSSGDDALWEIWQANDLDEQSQQGHFESIGLSRAYVFVGAGESTDDAPVVTIESPMQVFARRDPRTRRVIEAVKRWDVGDITVRGSFEQHAMLYTEGRRCEYIFDGPRGWREAGPANDYDKSIMPVVPLVNQPRILRPDGRSEFTDIVPLADAANKMATDMMVSGEYHAMPRRWASGLKESDFIDENGTQLNAWSRDAGTLWTTENIAAKFGQFTETDLAVFHNTIKLLGQLTAQLSGLPPHYTAFSGGDANPTSADAIRSSESQLVKRAERKQTYLGGSWEQVQRLILRFQTGEWDPKARSLETIWRDPSTPTLAQKADAIVKLATPIQGGRAIVPLEQARIDLGYTPEQRVRMAEMDREAMEDPYLARLSEKDPEPKPEPDVEPAEPAPVS